MLNCIFIPLFIQILNAKYLIIFIIFIVQTIKKNFRLNNNETNCELTDKTIREREREKWTFYLLFTLCSGVDWFFFFGFLWIEIHNYYDFCSETFLYSSQRTDPSGGGHEWGKEKQKLRHFKHQNPLVWMLTVWLCYLFIYSIFLIFWVLFFISHDLMESNKRR